MKTAGRVISNYGWRTVVAHTISVVVDQVEAVLVVNGSHVRLGNTKTDRVCEALAEGTGGNLDTRGVMSLGMSGSDAVNFLSKFHSNRSIIFRVTRFQRFSGKISHF